LSLCDLVGLLATLVVGAVALIALHKTAHPEEEVLI
jgi:hypothetical protein